MAVLSPALHSRTFDGASAGSRSALRWHTAPVALDPYRRLGGYRMADTAVWTNRFARPCGAFGSDTPSLSRRPDRKQDANTLTRLAESRHAAEASKFLRDHPCTFGRTGRPVAGVSMHRKPSRGYRPFPANDQGRHSICFQSSGCGHVRSPSDVLVTRTRGSGFSREMILAISASNLCRPLRLPFGGRTIGPLSLARRSMFDSAFSSNATSERMT